MLTRRKLIIGTVIFGVLHLFFTYASLFLAIASGLARFDGRPTSISAFGEAILAGAGAILLFPFGYLHIPFLGPWFNSLFWALFLYVIVSWIQSRRNES